MTNTRFKKTALALAASAALVTSVPALAFNFNTGSPDLSISWNNTLKYSTAFRLGGANPALLGYPDGSPAVNLDDGDRNFSSGLVSNRVDLLSEFNFRKNLTDWSYGVRVSGDAWYDSVYNSSNSNNSPQTSNNINFPHNEFTSATRTLMGRDAELDDAFLFASFNVGNTPVVTRLGRQALVYGQTLFFGANGIAAAQQPVDLIKLLNVPSSQFKEVVMPTWQASTNIQLSDDWSVGGYYQFQSRNSRLPPVGSYLSNTDFVGAGAEEIIVGAPLTPTSGPLRYVRGPDIAAKDFGQFGIKLDYSPADYDVGFYFAQYNAKDPQLYFVDEPNADPTGTGVLGQLVDVYPQDIKTAGVSLSTNVGAFNVAGEVSYRWNTPLVSDPQEVSASAGKNNSGNPAYAVGRTLHANLSTIYILKPTSLWEGGVFLGEIAWNMRTAIDRNPQALDPHTTKSATAIRFVFSPEYFQVLPGVDLNVPIGVGYNPFGRSSAVFNFNGGAQHGGDLSAGLDFVYHSNWFFDVNYVNHFGPAAPFLSEPNPGATPVRYLTYGQTLGDRNFISFDIHHTF